MAVVAVLVFVAAYILIATERVPKSRAVLLADLSAGGSVPARRPVKAGRWTASANRRQRIRATCGGARMRARMRVDGGLREVGPGCQGLRRAGTGSPAKCSARSNALA